MQSGHMAAALDNLKWVADYLMACHISDFEYVGQIGSSGEFAGLDKGASSCPSALAPYRLPAHLLTTKHLL